MATELTLAERVLAHVRATHEVGADFTAKELKMPEVKLHSLQNTLWVLSKKGYLDKPRGKGSLGRYILRGRKANGTSGRPVVRRALATGRDPEQVIIDDLLDCMARAEPILKKWSAIREALKGI